MPLCFLMSSKLERIPISDVYCAFIAKQVRAEPLELALALALGNDDQKKKMAPLSNTTIRRQGGAGMFISTVATNKFNCESESGSSVSEAEGKPDDDDHLHHHNNGSSTSNPLHHREFWADSAGYVCELKGLVVTKKTLHHHNNGSSTSNPLHHREFWAESAGYVCELKGLVVTKKTLTEGKEVHAHIIQSGLRLEVSLGTQLMIMYAKCQSVNYARQVFDEMPERNVVSWTAMIASYVKHGRSDEALRLFYQMQQAGVQPNQFTFASALPAFADLGHLQSCREVHGDIIRNGFESNIFVASALIDVYQECGSLVDARCVFDKMSQRNVVSWTAMIAGYAQNGQIDEALRLFERMPERNVVSWNAMIAGYTRAGLVDKAMELFQKMPKRDLVSWNSIIAGFAQNGRFDEALYLFEKTPKQDHFSWTAMIAGYAKNGQMDEALKLFYKIPKRDVSSWNAMIAGYVQNGLVGEAVALFEKMPERDSISWNSMIAGYAQNGFFNRALNLFGQMQPTGMKPDSVTYASILPACGSLAALEHGKQFHKDIIRNGFQFDIFVGNALVDMYAKCGSIWEAFKVFGKMTKRDVISWTAMIVGYAMNGHGKEAIKLFQQMQQSSTKPNHITFVGVLSACCHAGLVDDGWQYFHCMIRDYHITPDMEHYCCMVDLLGRAGLLDEAQDFINKMPLKPDASIWASLLGACRIHRNIDLGESLAECLFELDPENPAHYVLLSNLYAVAGRWDDKEKVRRMMKNRTIKKTPGRSWIEVNNTVHSFIVGDRSHPQTQKIYAKLDSLSGKMKETGYIPDTMSVLHDLEDEQKEHLICHHSEKLAIAFGLINTAEGMSIRIVKNLRVCGDCHSAMKFISKIVAREIVLRDPKRFHHFKDGLCSCGDYW